MGFKETVAKAPATPMTRVWILSLLLDDSRRWCSSEVKCPQQAHLNTWYLHSNAIWEVWELPGGRIPLDKVSH